ncbi:MAG TPA: GGDEF domain-containing protein [Xanthomonadales bacterium]|nr:GGDEF domain-containing protein [Xanthomonadales bacterium]
MRWRVAVVLSVLIVVLMAFLGSYNASHGFGDTSRLAWIVCGVAAAALTALLLLPRGPGGTVFFVAIALVLAIVPAYGLANGRAMQHWAYIVPPVLIFLLRPHPAFALMVAYGVYASLVTAQLVPTIDTIRFASGYGMLVCFMYTYALLENRAAAMLRFHSDHDALSNCLNRRTFNEAIDELVARGAQAKRCTFLLADIDHFKAINDQHGHLVGDRVITQAAAALMGALPAGTPLFRYGGEEFAAMLVDGDADAGAALADRLRSAVQAADFQGIPVTVSLGVAEWRAGEGTVDAALGRADRALYAAKRAGRNRVVVDSPLGPAQPAQRAG